METDYEKYIAISRYARYLPDIGRRETWEESVERYINHTYKQVKTNTSISSKELKEVYLLLGATCDA